MISSMDAGSQRQERPRFTLGKQSSMKPDREELAEAEAEAAAIDQRVRLMYMANEGDIDGINELLDSGTDVNFKDIDGRTALHVAACQGRPDVVQVLLGRGAEVDPKDRWGSTPFADAVHYKNEDVIKLLKEHGARPPMAHHMHVKNAREIPEYEIDPKELVLSEQFITKGTFRLASWRGIQVAVKTLEDEVLTDDNKVLAFMDELALLQKLRHPNVVQFLGAVTQSNSMTIVTKYLQKIMYRPLRDLNDIPGAKSLIVCLTGYQRQVREDIMNMVALGCKFF